jgi:hypothetical protein
VPAGHHPHDQGDGGGKAGREDQQDDGQLMIALITGQVREQQLSHASVYMVCHIGHSHPATSQTVCQSVHVQDF